MKCVQQIKALMRRLVLEVKRDSQSGASSMFSEQITKYKSYAIFCIVFCITTFNKLNKILILFYNKCLFL